MFILRHIQENSKSAVNTILGNHYQVVRFNGNEEQFAIESSLYWQTSNLEIPAKQRYEDGYYAFLVSEKITIPLKHGYNYIMTETGKTFENISDTKLPK